MELISKSKTGKKERPVKVLQFGEGNFLRGFVDYMIDIANEKGEFDGDIVLSFFQNVNTLFANFRYFFRAVYYACGNAPALDFYRTVCYTLSAECYCIEGGADNGRFEV